MSLGGWVDFSPRNRTAYARFGNPRMKPCVSRPPPSAYCSRLQQYARDARKEYTELGSKDLSELKTFVKGLPKLLLLDRLSDLAVPVAEVVKEQV